MKNRWIAAESFIKGMMPKSFQFSHFSGAKLKSTQIKEFTADLWNSYKRQIICSVWPCRGLNNDTTREELFRSVTCGHARNLLK